MNIATQTTRRPIATNEAVLRALGIESRNIMSLHLDMKPGMLPMLTLEQYVEETDPAGHIGGLDLDQVCGQAMNRIKASIGISVLNHLYEMRESWKPKWLLERPKEGDYIEICEIGKPPRWISR